LDPALIDRFPFVIPVPNWGELSRDDRIELVSWKNQGVNDEALDLGAVVEEVARLIPEMESEFEDWLGDYIVCLVDLLEQVHLAQSPRRARMLARNVAAIHAARVVLEGISRDDVDGIEQSAELAILYGMPQNATEVPPTPVKVVATHRQAWEMAQYLE